MTVKKFGFSKTKKLRAPADFKAVFDKPIRSRSQYFTILACPNSCGLARLGVMVAKRMVKRAVPRNTIRRIVRESFRQNQHQLVGLDLVVMTRCDLSRQQNRELYTNLERQWRDLITAWKNG